MLYKRKKIQHQILNHLNEAFWAFYSVPDPRKLKAHRSIEQISNELNINIEDAKRNVYELLDRNFVSMHSTQKENQIFTIKQDAMVDLYSEKLLREYREEYNKFWLTVLQYAFYIITIIVSIVTLSKATTSKEYQECKPRQEQISFQKEIKN